MEENIRDEETLKEERKNNLIAILIVILIVILVGVGCYFFYHKVMKVDSVPNDQIEEIEEKEDEKYKEQISFDSLNGEKLILGFNGDDNKTTYELVDSNEDILTEIEFITPIANVDINTIEMKVHFIGDSHIAVEYSYPSVYEETKSFGSSTRHYQIFYFNNDEYELVVDVGTGGSIIFSESAGYDITNYVIENNTLSFYYLDCGLLEIDTEAITDYQGTKYPYLLLTLDQENYTLKEIAALHSDISHTGTRC